MRRESERDRGRGGCASCVCCCLVEHMVVSLVAVECCCSWEGWCCCSSVSCSWFICLTKDSSELFSVSYLCTGCVDRNASPVPRSETEHEPWTCNLRMSYQLRGVATTYLLPHRWHHKAPPQSTTGLNTSNGMHTCTRTRTTQGRQSPLGGVLHLFCKHATTTTTQLHMHAATATVRHTCTACYAATPKGLTAWRCALPNMTDQQQEPNLCWRVARAAVGWEDRPTDRPTDWGVLQCCMCSFNQRMRERCSRLQRSTHYRRDIKGAIGLVERVHVLGALLVPEGKGCD